jgi:hypothetical protein
MNKREETMNKLSSGLRHPAAAVLTQQPAVSDKPLNNTTTQEGNNGVDTYNNNGISTELSNVVPNTEDVRRGPKKKGEFKKVTLNLDVELNRKLDSYINTLRGQAIEMGTEPPNKSEWVRDLVEARLRELGAL